MPIRQAPKGTTIVFKVNDATLPELDNVQLRLDEDLAISLSSEFSEVFSKGVSNFEKVVTDVIAGSAGVKLSSQFKEFGFQTWRKTAPLAVSITTTLNMKTDAFTDVVKPVRALCSLAIPDDTNTGDDGFGMILPGPNILTLFGLTEGNSAGEAIISCTIGWMKLKSVIVKKAEPVYSRKTDSNGYPIWAKVKMDIETVYTATKQMLLDMTAGEG